MSISTQSPKPYVIPHLDKVNCSGERMIFEVVPGTNNLAPHDMKEHVMPNENNNNVAFIECHPKKAMLEHDCCCGNQIQI